MLQSIKDSKLRQTAVDAYKSGFEVGRWIYNPTNNPFGPNDNPYWKARKEENECGWSQQQLNLLADFWFAGFYVRRILDRLKSIAS